MFRWDPKPSVFVKGAQCPAHCGGQAAEAPCVVAKYDFAVENTVTCVLPSGAAGSNMDVTVAVGDKSADFFGLSYGGCNDGAATNPATGTCANCTAGTYSSPVEDACAPCAGGTWSGAGALVCTRCDEGKISSASRAACQPCAAGTYAQEGAQECSPCPLGTFSMSGAPHCKPCPETRGVECPGGVLTPQDNWWSPAVLSPDDASSAAFDEDTLLYLCQGKMCVANITDDGDGGGSISHGEYTPLNAYRCAPAHRGVLCSSCVGKHFMRKNACTACDGSGLSDTAVHMIAGLAATAVLVGVLLLLLRRNSKTMNRRLVLERKDLEARRKQIRKSISSGRSLVNVGGDGGDGGKEKAMSSKERLHSRVRLHIVLKIKTYAVEAAHGMVKAAQSGDIIGETGRIVLGFGQVMHHLYATLAYCILWPAAMQSVLSAAALIAFDPIEQLKMPCWMVNGMPYYVKLQLLVGAPLLISLACCVASFAVHMARSHYKHRRDLIKLQAAAAQRMIAEGPGANVAEHRERHRRQTQMHRSHYKVKMKASAHHGMLRCVSIVCLVMDVTYPSVTRTILQLFRCRELGTPSNSQLFLEADYARRDSAEHFSRLNAPLFTAMAWIFIPAYCFAAIP